MNKILPRILLWWKIMCFFLRFCSRFGAAVPTRGGEALPVSSHLQSQPQHPGGSCRSTAEPRCGTLGCEWTEKFKVLHRHYSSRDTSNLVRALHLKPVSFERTAERGAFVLGQVTAARPLSQFVKWLHALLVERVDGAHPRQHHRRLCFQASKET